jgi:hypothetical protein
MLKAHPELLRGWQARAWTKFFCLTVYITMYLNDHTRSAFYEALGLNTTQFCKHVILQTNETSKRTFPEVGRMGGVGGRGRRRSREEGSGSALAATRTGSARYLI